MVKSRRQNLPGRNDLVVASGIVVGCRSILGPRPRSESFGIGATGQVWFPDRPGVQNGAGCAGL